MNDLRVSRVHFPVTALGPGTRLTIWTQGCPLACRGCMSRDTWDPSGGAAIAIKDLETGWLRAAARGATGLTVSGGEPLTQPAALAVLLARVRAVSPAADILLYTGYEPAELNGVQEEAAALADVLIVGRYEASLPTRLIWRGSANQRMILQTPLGRARYAAHEHEEVQRTPMQAVVKESGEILLIGVPPPGSLGKIERELRSRGIRLNNASQRS
ncbi:4Fe-4S single cluster domain-containing protein [Nonomuraea sp. NPDC050556]|uniref:4Fe-4S single cluster domain-containing protein n=1 Tax=Nonomuraea sp. NPDC050556 TaxID=3364369 RepID=UPI0037BC4C34